MEFIEAILHVENKNIYVYCTPEIPDFTNLKNPAKLVLNSSDACIELIFPTTQPEFFKFLGVLNQLFGNPKKLVYGWNLNALFAYIQGRSGKPFVIEGPKIDLKIAEAFHAIHQQAPETYDEAHNRFMKLRDGDSWASFKELYKEIYLPLIYSVLPGMETSGLVDKQKKKKVYSYYELEGTVNGRMTTKTAYSQCFQPHTMGAEQRQVLYPAGYDEVFMYFDYKNMEVSVLQWLTQCPVLKEILVSGKDVYESIWEIITGSPPNETSRQRCKAIFLPVMYGLGPKGISNRIEISETSAIKLHELLTVKFSVIFRWLYDFKRKNGNTGIDKYGRKRHFTAGEEYKLLNYAVAAPASTICLHKLVELSKKLHHPTRLAFYLHDGYCIIVGKNNANRTYEQVKSILTTDHELYKGLYLQVACQTGLNVAELKIGTDKTKENNARDLQEF